MAGTPGTAYYDVDASAIGLTPVTSTSGAGSANTAALQAALGTLDTGLDRDIHVRFNGGPYYFNGAVDVPCERRCYFNLNGNRLVNLHATEPIFRLKLQNDNGWYASCFDVRDGMITGDGGAVGTYNAGSLDPRVAEFRMQNLFLSTTKRPVEVTMQYTINPLISDCKFIGNSQQEGGIYWAPGRVEGHGSSMMRIYRCHFHQNNTRKYPCLWMSGGRGLEIDSCIFEGVLGWHGSATPEDFERAVGIYLENWGFYQTVIKHNWFEFVDYGTRDVDFNVILKNGTSGNLGVNAPQSVVFEDMDPSYIKIMNDAGSFHPYVVYVERAIHAVYRQTNAGITTVGPCRVVVDKAPVSNQALSLETDANQKIQREWSGQDSGDYYQATLYQPGPEPVYVNKGGGTGNDGSGITAGNITTYPHRHPVYGPCTAVRGYGYGITIPSGRRMDGVRTAHFRARLCSPNHVVQGGATPGVWAQVLVWGNQASARMIPAGYAPTELAWGTDVVGSVGQGMALGDWFSTYPGGVYVTPSSPWLLYYGLSVAYNRPFHLELQYPHIPIRFLEWSAGAGPPAGTYEFGDTVFTMNGGLPYVCDQPGTSRTISKTCNTTATSAVLTGITNAGDILEGDFLTLAGVARGRVLTVADNGNITLDTAVPSTLTGTALTNKSPTFARRRV